MVTTLVLILLTHSARQVDLDSVIGDITRLNDQRMDSFGLDSSVSEKIW